MNEFKKIFKKIEFFHFTLLRQSSFFLTNCRKLYTIANGDKLVSQELSRNSIEKQEAAPGDCKNRYQ